MILSDADIREFIGTGDIIIAPFDSSKLKSASYTFTLGARLFRLMSGMVIDARNPSRDGYEQIEMGESGYLLQSGQFLLGQTRETLSLSTKVSCMLDARTTLARIGLTVLQGSMFVEPGQSESRETLEVKNIGPNAVQIFPGMDIVKGVFMLLRTPAERGYAAYGEYAQQSDARPKVADSHAL